MLITYRLEQRINNLKNTIEDVNKNSVYLNRLIDIRLSITVVEKCCFVYSECKLDPNQLESVAENVWKALMTRQEFEQAELLARNIGI